MRPLYKIAGCVSENRWLLREDVYLCSPLSCVEVVIDYFKYWRWLQLKNLGNVLTAVKTVVYETGVMSVYPGEACVSEVDLKTLT